MTSPAQDLVQLSERVEWDGRQVELRPIHAGDEAMHRFFLEHIAREDLRLRFFDYRKEFSDREIAHLVDIDSSHEMAFVAQERMPDGSEREMGVARVVVDAVNAEAEFAILIRSELHGKGLGSLLLQKAIGYLRSRGTKQMVCDVLHENVAMRALAVRHGFRLQHSAHSQDSLRYVLDLAPASAPGVEAR